MADKLTLVESPRPDDEKQYWKDTYLKEDFVECAACRAQPGSPTLCFGCICNRTLIGHLKTQLGRKIDTVPTMNSNFVDWLENWKPDKNWNENQRLIDAFFAGAEALLKRIKDEKNG